MSIPLPANVPDSPFYIDTQSCQCALQLFNSTAVNFEDEEQEEAWRCIGDSHGDPYTGESGKWFLPVNPVKFGDGGTNDVSQPFDWDGNPPDLSKTHIVDNTTHEFELLDDTNKAQLAVLDNACSGQNSSDQSGKYYGAVRQVQAGQTPTEATLCYAGTTPVELQNASSWTTQGCNLGFFCQNNTVIRLPQWCPPVYACNSLRLAGGTCPLPMGPLEPIICHEGNYCPAGGKESIQCPAGHFCSKGAYKPTKCSIGSSCPPGSIRDMSFLPLGLLLLLDILMVAFVIWNKLRDRTNKGKKTSGKSKSRRSLMRRAVTSLGAEERARQYESLEDNEFAMTPRIMRVDTGFGGEVPVAFDPDDDDDFGSIKKPSSDLQLFIRSMSRCIGATNFGLSFEFENLAFHPKKAAKPILSEVTGKINRGSLSGVMGASGAGKSTFVNVLMGKQNHTGGVTKVNGVSGNISKYKKIIGYVPQDDIVLPELTVRENILHSARIRLPANWSDAEIHGHVDILISCLQLAHVKDSFVGSAAAPVISGGQRKRVSIGMELAALPMALFLDEPTSGLDATSAASIMTTLKELSRLGITIVTIIHQPRQEIFESLDNLLLFGAGRMIYSGPTDRVQPYFENVGFRFPAHGNPADVVMDIIAGQGGLYKSSGDTDIMHLIEHWKNRESSIRRHASMQSVSTQETQALRKSIKLRGAPWYRQIYYCFLRSILQQYRFKGSFFAELGVGALAGFLIGLAQLSQDGINFRGLFLPPYDVLSSANDYSSVPQMSLLVGLSIGLTASSPGVKIFGEEKLIYWREAASGHNRFAYYMGKVLSTIPRMVLANLHFSVLFYLLTTPRISWAAAFTANLLYFWCIYGLASMISMITRREDGPLLAVMLSLIVGVLNGMSPSLRQVRIWRLQWLWRASPGTWLAEGYFDQNVGPLDYLYQIRIASDYMGYNIGEFRLDLGMLMVIGTVCRVLAFVLMRVMNRHKQK